MVIALTLSIQAPDSVKKSIIHLTVNNMEELEVKVNEMIAENPNIFDVGWEILDFLDDGID